MSVAVSNCPIRGPTAAAKQPDRSLQGLCHPIFHLLSFLFDDYGIC